MNLRFNKRNLMAMKHKAIYLLVLVLILEIINPGECIGLKLIKKTVKRRVIFS